MKTILLFLFLLGAGSFCFGQYTVTKVIGKVKNKTSGEMLKTGSKLSDDDVLGFSTPNDMLRVIVSGKGIYVISPSPKSIRQDNLIVEMLKSALHINSKEGYLSGRSGNNLLLPATLETESKVNSMNLIAAENKYAFDPGLYNVSNGRFFLQIESPGAKAVIRPLRTVADTLILYASDFETGSAKTVGAAKYKIGFFSREKGNSESLAEIKPYMDTTREMQSIVDVIIRESKNMDQKELKKTCYAEVYEALGKPSDISFTNVFNTLIANRPKK